MLRKLCLVFIEGVEDFGCWWVGSGVDEVGVDDIERLFNSEGLVFEIGGVKNGDGVVG